VRYEPEEPFLIFFHMGEWDALLREHGAPDRPYEIAAGRLWCNITQATAQEFATELRVHRVPGMPEASWDRVAAHMVWTELGNSPRLMPGERQGSLF
jgi:hypothetical protein